MPYYEFVCLECHAKFTEALHIADLAKIPVKCPECGSQKTEQQVTAFAAVTSKKS